VSARHVKPVGTSRRTIAGFLLPLLSVTCLVSCGVPQPDEIQPYVDQFYSESKKRGHTLPPLDWKIVIGFNPPCTGPTFCLDPTEWATLTEPAREKYIFGILAREIVQRDLFSIGVLEYQARRRDILDWVFAL
jgi:hypothetical protein